MKKVIEKVSTELKTYAADMDKFEKILLITNPLLFIIWKSDNLLPFFNKQGEVKKADEEFFVNIFKTANENNVKEIKLKLKKEQLTGLNTTIRKSMKETGFNCDFGIKGKTDIELEVKFK